MVGRDIRTNAYLTEVFPEMEPAPVGLPADPIAEVEGACAALPPGRWVLAISGGRDSMALLTAMARMRRRELAAVATFDHGTGAAATAACDLAEAVATAAGVPVRRGRGSGGRGSEAAWRAARYRFLNRVAGELGARLVTAHTEDDQIETVLLRLLRGSGVRGLAGMLAASGPARPLLSVSRAMVDDYLRLRAVSFVDDPSNARPDFLRNRVRHELLPAFERSAPGFRGWCRDLGGRAAAWRRDVEALVDAMGIVEVGRGAVAVPASAVEGCPETAGAVLWPALAARAGIVMDRRGIARASAWAPRARAGQRIPLSGGARLERTAATFVLRGTPDGPQDYIE